MSTMTRQHFQVIAASISAAREAISVSSQSNCLATFDFFVMPAFVRALEAQNPRFDRTRFLAACGIDPQPALPSYPLASDQDMDL